MVERTLSNMVINEYTIYEASKCLRRSFLLSKNTVYNLFKDDIKIKKRTRAYLHYEDSLEYSILKKIYYYTANILLKDNKISFDNFKKFSLLIIEKEIESNKKKALELNLNKSDYNRIRRKIIIELDKHFSIINHYDFENNISSFITLNINVKDVIDIALKPLRKKVSDKITNIEFKKGIPALKIDILAIEKINDFSFDLILTSILNINKDLIHTNYLISILFIYFKNLDKNNSIFKEHFHSNALLNNIVIYNPLTLKRHKISYSDITGTFSINEFIKLLKIYNESLDFKNLDKNSCNFCENISICKNKNTTMSYRKKHLSKYIKNNEKA